MDILFIYPAESEGLFQVNHKYPVFSGANIGIKPICLTIILCSLICIEWQNVGRWLLSNI